jgi:Fungal specific transcription factor domain
VAADDVTAALYKNEEDTLTYALANAVGAATVAQLKLNSLADTASASSMEAECHRIKNLECHGQFASLDTLKIAFFLHVYHENLEPGGVSSLSYLREAITLAQIMGLHRESTYTRLSSSDQELRRRIFWLLFVTERYVPCIRGCPVTDLAKRGCNAS